MLQQNLKYIIILQNLSSPFYYNSGFCTWKIIGYIKYLDQHSVFKEDAIVKWMEKIGWHKLKGISSSAQEQLDALG